MAGTRRQSCRPLVSPLAAHFQNFSLALVGYPIFLTYRHGGILVTAHLYSALKNEIT